MTQNQLNYRVWLKHPLLHLDHICLLAMGYEPTKVNETKLLIAKNFSSCPIHSVLCSAVKDKQIKSYSDMHASPLECIHYLKNFGFNLPEDLKNILENETDQIQNFLTKKKIRTKESFQQKETRGDEILLIAVLKTLLDLYPHLPKEKLINLKPIQEYANGHRHSSKYLRKLITVIEGQKRKGGNKNKSKTEALKRTIPPSWLNAETGSHHA